MVGRSSGGCGRTKGGVEPLRKALKAFSLLCPLSFTVYVGVVLPGG